MFGSVSKPVKTTYTQNDVTSHGLSLSWKQQFLCRWTQCHLVSNTDVTGNIPASRSKHAICFYGDYIYMYGGQYGSTGYRDLWRYNIEHSGWEILRGTGELPSLLQSHTLVANEDKLYVFGGNFSADLETPLWIFHLGTLHWRKHAVRSEVMTPCSRRGHTAVLSHGAMHIYGGYVDLKGSNSELWTFDFVTDGWHLGYCAEDGKPGPSARHDHSAVVYGGAMWVFGGVMNLEAKSDLWCWNFDTHQWKRVKGHHGVPELCGHSACTVADSMLIFGGSTQGERQNALWRFHFGTSAWQRVRCEGVPPSPCDYHSIVVFQQRGSPPADRSHSAPHVGRNCSALLGPRTPQLRPNSSPAAMAAIHGTVPFQNKVEPCCKNSTWSSSPERCEIEMCVAQRARTENPPLDATRVSCPLCSATGTLAMYQLRKSWSIDFCTRTGLRFRKVTDTRPLIRNGKYTNSSSENVSLSSFGGSMNPIYDNSPPYTSIDQFQCRITDHENIPLKKLRQDNAAPLSARYDFYDNGASQFLASTRLCLGENRSHMGQSKLKNHFKSSSLESLLSRFDSAEIGGTDNQVTCRSVMKDDLIIEDIEETSFSCSDDVTNEIVMSSDKQSQEQGHFNCRATITNDVVACKVSDSSKSLIFVNNSATSDLHPVNVDTTGQLVRSDTNELRESDNETMCHSKMAWLLPSGEGSKENVAANTNYFEEKCEDEVIPDNEEVLVKMIAPSVTLSASGDTWHMSAVSDDRNPALWQMSTNGAVYHMFVFGGRVDEAQSHPVKPISISKLQISTMLI